MDAANRVYHSVLQARAADAQGCFVASRLQLRGYDVTPARRSDQWQLPLPPGSGAVCPVTGMNCQAYVPSPRVSFSTPNTPLIFTSLFGTICVLGRSWPSPPVPTMISRIPFTGSGAPVGVWGANRS